MLSGGELMRLPTYKRPCRVSQECESPLACIFDTRVSRFRCLASECDTALHCEPGFTCQVIRGYPVVRICKPVGARQEGERCNPDSSKKGDLCSSGLLCIRGTCSRPCEPGRPGVCLRGTKCVHSLGAGYTCVPQCSPGDCPPGKECIRFGDELSVCGVLVTANCDLAPCPEDHICDRDALSGERIAMQCLLMCSREKPCPEGHLCSYDRCRRICTKNEECSAQQECVLQPNLKAPVCEFRDRQ